MKFLGQSMEDDMVKRIVRCGCFLIAAIMCFTFAVCATETEGARSSSFFRSSSVYLYKTSGNNFEAWFEVTALGTMTQLGASKIKIQRSLDGVNWTTMKTYEKEDYSQMICNNTVTHDGCVSYTGTTGYYYRAIVILYAKNSSGTAEMTEYTAKIKL